MNPEFLELIDLISLKKEIEKIEHVYSNDIDAFYHLYHKEEIINFIVIFSTIDREKINSFNKKVLFDSYLKIAKNLYRIKMEKFLTS